MMVVGRKRKRYLFLASSGPTDEEARKEFTRIILERHPGLDRKKMVWLDQGVIVRTDPEGLLEMKWGPAFRVGATELVTKSASGSISKLKRMASDRGG
jgi:hypothetical protein